MLEAMRVIMLERMNTMMKLETYLRNGYQAFKVAEEYFPDCFRKEMYIQAYSQYLTPVNVMSFWPECGESSIILPAKPKTILGRPSKKRIKARHETVGTEMTCQNCDKKGHNKAGCKKEKMVKPPKPPTKKDDVEGSNAPEVKVDNVGHVRGTSVAYFRVSGEDNVVQTRKEKSVMFVGIW
ncbi:hypothetical protein Tco_1434095 [Tanacetum coccineum]